ncbi:tRNA (6-N-(L-threonyl-N)-carbonyladenosine37-C2)-methylthiotransferase [Geotalea daltonii FRC-32]|uniref:Threonylcarbamoyladenosine tRNA methylthiotransferase MtaB n=1 Tax=Geotalea daltonii (strain DSM 22248 / JCM 15807 / FRC-32) TaxID=316067 RepID=B9M869_GEODF|nr:tRNA (N(6)-L-threonylcarbamoyladenosine(37)-C(2))-methylthiotransferase MtaB [Geotalea daltonii]ACM20335.1 tRNA (6-N-(L-threonyl-N)-carbonyladenosine37-C2)-methylthiotransferase [Geotalea daltonii FRC-32]
MVNKQKQTVAITTLGCKINQFESAAMAETLGKEGFSIVPFDGAADIYVINTCTVTSKTDAESRRLIRRASRQNPSAKIVVTGCYAQVAFEELQDMPGVNLILGNSEKKGIAEMLKDLGENQRVLVSDISRELNERGTRLESFAEHTRAFLQVQNGCDAFCSYCIVPYARGRSRSVSLEEALAGIRTFAERGFKEVVLTGIHLGAYGLDLNPPLSLLDLLNAAEKERLVERIRIGSVEPTEVSDALISFLAKSATVCPHLHIPLQSGHDRVLKAMNRNYSTADFRSVMEKLDTDLPSICIGTDIITGFPGETDDEFQDGYRFLESLPLAYFHVFPFSPRSGTPAATMEGHVHSSVIKERAKALRKLSEEKKKSFYRSFIGEKLQVLVQTREGDLLKGLSRNYIPVFMEGDDDLLKTEQLVRITGVEREKVTGEVISSAP